MGTGCRVGSQRLYLEVRASHAAAQFTATDSPVACACPCLLVALPTSVLECSVQTFLSPGFASSVQTGSEGDASFRAPGSPLLTLTFALLCVRPAEATGRRLLQPPGSREAQTARGGRAQAAGAGGAGPAQTSAAPGLRAPGPAAPGRRSSSPASADRLLPPGPGPVPRPPVHRQARCVPGGGGGGLQSGRSGRALPHQQAPRATATPLPAAPGLRRPLALQLPAAPLGRSRPAPSSPSKAARFPPPPPLER